MAEEKLKEELKKKLKEIFQFENEDLDFGIYRIMNYKRKEIDEFIEKELIDEIKKQLQLVSEEERKEIEEKMKEISSKNGVKKYLEALEKGDEERLRIYEEDFEKQIGEYERLKRQLEEIKISEDLEREIYNHLIVFFSRYYDKGDFITKRRYGKNEKYAVPYNGEEILLYWANKDHYYIKTTDYFKKYIFKTLKGDIKVIFRVVEAEEEKANIKSPEKKFFVLNEKVFDFDKDKRELSIYFEYRGLTEEEEEKYKHGQSASQDKINEEVVRILEEKIPQNSLARLMFKKEGEKTLIEKHLYRYTRRNTTDYFIHKDLKGFLERELDFYIKNEFLQLEDLQILEQSGYFDKLRLYLIGVKAFRNIALKIIEFLAQIENFQKKLWEKKKFVIDTHYVITLDKIKEFAGEEFLESILDEILSNEKQLEEWKELFGIKGNSKDDLILNNGQLQLNGKEWKKLPIDTKYFDEEFKWKLLVALSKNNDLDKILDGILINSENFQALNLLLNKYYERVQTIYIDPPYNTGSDEFLYKDNYQHASWLTMIENRLRLAKELMNDSGIFFSNIDDNEVDNFGVLLRKLFRENKTDKIIWKKASDGRWGKMKNVKTFRKDHEYIMVTYKEIEEMNKLREKPQFKHEHGNPDNDPRGPYKVGSISRKEEASDPNHPNYYTVISPTGKKFTRQWDFPKEEFERLDRDGRIYWGKDGNSVPGLKIFLNEEREVTPYSVLIEKGTNTEAKEEFLNILGKEFEIIINQLNPKPHKLIKTLLQISTKRDSCIIDFFAGSGTTAHAVMKLNKEDGRKRKFILVEMADYFDTVIIPRIKKVAYSFNWKEGKPQDTDAIGVFFKYHTLEQYEDALENIEFDEIMGKKVSELLPDYIFYMLEWETKQSTTFLNLEKMQVPFSYKLKIIENYQQKIVNVDLVETFNYLLGLLVKGYKVLEENGRKYVFVFGEKEGKRVEIVWRSVRDIDFEKDKDVIEREIKKLGPAEIYINGDAVVKGFRAIEPLFKQLMFEEVR